MSFLSKKGLWVWPLLDGCCAVFVISMIVGGHSMQAILAVGGAILPLTQGAIPNLSAFFTHFFCTRSLLLVHPISMR
jgi:hypothetical protein